MKHNVTRYSLLVLLVGFSALADGQVYARQQRNWIAIQSLSWGMSNGQTARLSAANFVFVDGSVRSGDPSVVDIPVIVYIQLLDQDGEVLAQSDEIRVEPGQTRFWDAPRESLPAGESTGRLQLRARILITTGSADLDGGALPLALTLELIDSGTGRTSAIWHKFLMSQEFPGR